MIENILANLKIGAAKPNARGVHQCLERGKRPNIIVSYGSGKTLAYLLPLVQS